jgi:hypothetical protein
MNLSKCNSLEEFKDILRDEFNLVSSIKVPNYDSNISCDCIYPENWIHSPSEPEILYSFKVYGPFEIDDCVPLLHLSLTVNKDSNIKWEFIDHLNKKNNWTTVRIKVAKLFIEDSIRQKLNALHLFSKKESTIKVLLEEVEYYGDDLLALKGIIERILKYIERNENKT